MLTLQRFEMLPGVPEERRRQCGRKPFDPLCQLKPLADPFAFVPVRIANKQLADTDLGLSLPFFDSRIAIDQPLGASEHLINFGQLRRQRCVTNQVEFDPLPSPVDGFGFDRALFRDAGERHDARPRNRPAGIVP